MNILDTLARALTGRPSAEREALYDRAIKRQEEITDAFTQQSNLIARLKENGRLPPDFEVPVVGETPATKGHLQVNKALEILLEEGTRPQYLESVRRFRKLWNKR